jgi:hypothetical protein
MLRNTFIKLTFMKKLIVTTCLFFVLFTLYAQTSPIISTLAGNGTPGYSGDNGPATAAQLKSPWGLAVDDAGNVYVGDINRVVRKVSVAGIITTFAGNGTSGYSGDNGPATAAEIVYSPCITTDKKGNIYIGDKFRVRKVDAAGIITTFAGNGVSSISGDGGPATAASIGSPSGLCSDDTGNIYISAGGGNVRKIDTFGIIHAFAGGGATYTEGGPATAAHLMGSSQITMDNMGNLYISGQTNIYRVSTAGIITSVAGSFGNGYRGDNGPATSAWLNNTSGVAADKCGNIYIADGGDNLIRVVNDLGIITRFAGTGYGMDTAMSGLIGGYTGDGGPATAAELFRPINICLDKHGSIYFTEVNNNIVRYIHMDSCMRAISHVAVTGPAAFKEGLAVYPNPSTGTFTVIVQSASKEAVHITICNMVGMKVGEYDAMTNETWRPEHSIPPGVYLLHASMGHGRYVEKIVVR